MTDTTENYIHPALVGPWEVTAAAIKVLIERGDMPNLGAFAVYNTATEVCLLRAFIDPERADEDQAHMRLALDGASYKLSWDNPDTTFVVFGRSNGVAVAFSGAGTSYDGAIVQLLLRLTCCSLSEYRWATADGPDPTLDTLLSENRVSGKAPTALLIARQDPA